MDRSALLGPESGYQPGGGYRPESLTLPSLAVVLLFFAGVGMLEYYFGHRLDGPFSRAMSPLTPLFVGAWLGVRGIGRPDEARALKTDSERRRDRFWTAVCLVLMPVVAFFPLREAVRLIAREPGVGDRLLLGTAGAAVVALALAFAQRRPIHPVYRLRRAIHERRLKARLERGRDSYFEELRSLRAWPPEAPPPPRPVALAFLESLIPLVWVAFLIVILLEPVH